MAIVIPILTEFSGKGIAKARKEFAQLETVGEKAGFLLKKSMLPVGAAIAGIGAAAFQAGEALLGMANAAAEDQKEQVQLAKTLQATTKATSSQVAGVEDYIDVTQRATGVADSKLRPAFARLVRSTRDTEKAQKLLNLSLDIAGMTGKDVEAVANALGKAYDGSNMAIGRLGLGLDKATLKGLSFEELQKRLEKQFKGGAAAAADTYEGKMARLQIRFDEFKETVGQAILPLLERLAEGAIKVADAFAEDGLGGALSKLREISPGFYNFMKTTYNVIASVGDVAYNAGRAVKQFFDMFQGKFSLPKWEKWMPSWESLVASDWGARTNVGGAANAGIVGGVPGVAGPLGGNGAAGSGLAGIQSSSIGGRVAPQQVNVTVTSADPRAVVDALVRYNRQNGAIPVTVGR